MRIAIFGLFLSLFILYPGLAQAQNEHGYPIVLIAILHETEVIANVWPLGRGSIHLL